MLWEAEITVLVIVHMPFNALICPLRAHLFISPIHQYPVYNS